MFQKSTHHKAEKSENLRRDAEQLAAALLGLLTTGKDSAFTTAQGEHPKKRVGQGEEFWQFREYQDSDRPQDIDWRQSAKGTRVFTRQKELQNPQNHLIWCNRSQSMGYRSSSAWPTKKHAAQLLTMALGILWAKTGEHLSTPEKKRSDRGETALQNLEAYLLPSEEESLPKGNEISLPSNSFLLLSGDFLGPIDEIEKNLEPLALQTRNALLLQILDPAELNLPFHGHTVFEDMYGEKQTRIDDVQSVRAAYQEKIEAHIESLKALCDRYNWHYYKHHSDQNMVKTLENLWLMTGHPA